MALIDTDRTATGQVQFCPSCGEPAGNSRYCPNCGQAIPLNVDASNGATVEQPGVAPNAPPSSGRSRVALISVVAALGLAAIAVAVIVLASGGSGSSQGSASASSDSVYRQKLQSALSPLMSPNQSLSSALTALDGSQHTIVVAQNATGQALSALTAARGAVAVLTVPSSDQTLSQQVQQALTNENGYLQAVSSTLATPVGNSAATLQPLVTSAQSSLVPLAGVAPGASSGLSGTSNLISWSNGAAAAAGRAHDHAQQQAVQQAASNAAQQAVSNSNSAASSSPSAGPGYGVQDLPVQCGYGVAGSAGMTCTFAENAFYEYWSASGGDPARAESINVWSAEGQSWYPLSCSAGDGVVDCTGANSSGVLLDARFTQSSVSAYTTDQAAAYAASGKLGP